jgi:hypothetical protein
MANTRVYIPKPGDRVLKSDDPSSTYVVHLVHTESRTADLRRINSPDYLANAVNVDGVSWESLTTLESDKREDLNQAAARIVREATEN